MGQGDPLKEEMATHPSILAWEIPWTEEPGELQSMGSQRIGNDLATERACTHQVISWNLRFYIADILWIIEKAREFQKNIYFCFIDYAKAFDCVDHNKLWKILEEMGIPDHLTCLFSEIYVQVSSNS